MKAVVYDAGVLIAADRNNRRIWIEHRVYLEEGFLPLVPAPVLAQVSRSTQQVQLRRFLRGCEIAIFDEAAAHRVGGLLACTRTTDVVDASVVELAVQRRAEIVTSDTLDIQTLVVASRAQVRIRSFDFLPLARCASFSRDMLYSLIKITARDFANTGLA